MTKNTEIKKVGVIFSGGPAPSANAVISSAAMAFRRSGISFVGFKYGYSALAEYDAQNRPLVEDVDYRVFQNRDLWGLRNERGIFIGTARANPGKGIKTQEDLDNSDLTVKLNNVYQALLDLGIDALISIGGDDTLKTANFFYEYQDRLPEGSKRIKIVHLPKTIDNDYQGIDFTFGFFTAVDVMAKELLNLRADAVATQRYYIAECMGRKSGWLSYGVSIAGESHMVVGVEDVVGDLLMEEQVVDSKTGQQDLRSFLSLDALVERVVRLMTQRQEQGKGYGTVVLAEGLVELLPPSFIDGLPKDEHGHISLGLLNIGKMVAERAGRLFKERTGIKKSVVGIQLGYEARCAAPHAFDVMLGCQLGQGAFRALVEEGIDGHMVSITGQLDLCYVPFDRLIDRETMLTKVRFIEADSDFYRLAHSLGTQLRS
ncbi:MAG: 6-phosphofructokinase [Proteobacteria bacterium]|nr:6-phosphofructokinase [Pseudomonadota bacterium]